MKFTIFDIFLIFIHNNLFLHFIQKVKDCFGLFEIAEKKNSKEQLLTRLLKFKISRKNSRILG